MRLRLRILVIVSLTIGVLLIGSLVAIRFISRSSMDQNLQKMTVAFSEVEKHAAEKNVERLQDIYHIVLSQIENRMLDWAEWDDTWKYMEHHNQAFIKSNLDSIVIAKMGYSGVLFFDTQDRLITSIYIDDKAHQIPVPASLLANLQKNPSPLHVKDSDDIHSGMFIIDGKPILFAARPIVKSSGQGPIRGTLVFTLPFDQTMMKVFTDLSHLELKSTIIHNTNSVQEQDYPSLAPINDIQFNCSILIKDYFGAPSMILTATTPRSIHSTAMEASKYIRTTSQWMGAILLLGTAVCGVLMMVILSWMVNRFVLNKIEILEDRVYHIGRKGNLDLHIPDLGHDEIGQLAMSFNTMLDSLKEARQSIQSQSMERKALMDALPIGLLALDAKFRIAGYPSHTAMHLLGKDCVGKRYGEALELTTVQEAELVDYLDVFAQGLLQIHDLHGLNPIPEITIHHEGEHWLRLSYFPLPHGPHPQEDDQVLLAVLQDVTNEHIKQEELKDLQADNAWLKAILADPDLFIEFFRESFQNMQRVRQHLTPPLAKEPITDAFRHVHTLHGCASGFGINLLANSSVILEKELRKILQDMRNPQTSTDDLHSSEISAQASLIHLEEVLKKEQARLLETLNIQSIDWKTGPSLRVPLHNLREWSALLASGECAFVFHAIEDALRIPLHRLLNRTMLWFPGMILRSNKQAELHLIGGDLKLPIDWSPTLNDILVHLLRNCIAHAIEDPEVRSLRGKPDMGSIRIIATQDAELFTLSVEDDGNGFEVPIKEAFSFGYSSRAVTTDLAGQGVGLSAVRSMVQELGGSIDIQSIAGKGSIVTMHFVVSASSTSV